jgi:hypothetical protein
VKQLSKQEFKDKRVLSKLYIDYAKNKNLTQIVLDCLSADLKIAISQSILFQNTLTIVVSNQLLASKLRYSLTNLKNKLKTYDEFKALRKIKLHIQSSQVLVHGNAHRDKQAIANDKNLTQPVYSNHSSDLINNFSNSVKDEELQESLDRLAKHIRERRE